MQVLAIEQHYLDNHKRLIKKIARRVGTIWAAEDVVHDAYERAIRYRRACKEDMFGQWFSQILNNSVRSWQASERGHYGPEVDEEEVAETITCPLYPERIMKEVYELIDTKSDIQIEVLSYYFRHELAVTDIADLTTYPYKRVHQIVLRFRNELKELYQ
mgnify:FL=1